MNAPAPAVVQGALVDAKNVAAHKCVRLSIDVPAELGASIVEAFGWPTMADPVSVAVARIDLNATRKPERPQEGKEKRHLSELPPATQAALTCQREAFWRYLSEARSYHCASEAEAADYVRAHCQVVSRAELATNAAARQRWNLILSAFNAWMEGGPA